MANAVKSPHMNAPSSLPSINTLPVYPSQGKGSDPYTAHLPSPTTPVFRDTPKTFMCETCGKIYKHPNCLSKHKWEHTEYWKEAAKFSLSKHQQVQLLEAASILIALANGVASRSSIPPPSKKQKI